MSLYITDDTMPLPYGTFPSYFDEVVSALDQQGDNSLRNLCVKSFGLLGNSLDGVMASVDNVDSGHTPLTYVENRGTIHTVTALGNQTYVFDHWENGSTNPARQVSVQGDNAYLTAYYRFEKNLPSARLIVDSYTLDGTEMRGLWSVVTPHGSSVTGGYTPFTQPASAGSSYAITAQDSDIYTFNHWEDESTNRTKVVAPLSDVTLTAYYRTPPATLAVSSADQSGNSLQGMYATVAGMDGRELQSDYTNMTYAESPGSVYTVTASDYPGMAFDHWQDGMTGRTRNVMLSSDNTEMVAYYRTAGAQRGLTPATFTGLPGPLTILTVNVASLDGRPLAMWSLANPEADGSYAVTVHNY